MRTTETKGSRETLPLSPGTWSLSLHCRDYGMAQGWPDFDNDIWRLMSEDCRTNQAFSHVLSQHFDVILTFVQNEHWPAPLPPAPILGKREKVLESSVESEESKDVVGSCSRRRKAKWTCSNINTWVVGDWTRVGPCARKWPTYVLSLQPLVHAFLKEQWPQK